MGFTLQGLLLATIGTPSGAPCPPGVSRVDSPHPHGERADAAAFRASIPSTSSFCHSGSRRTRRADAFLGFIPSERSLSSAFTSASVRGGSLHTRWAVRRPVPPASRGLPARGDRLSPLGDAGSPGFLHLSTVTAPRGSGRGAGSWFRLTARARCKRREPIHAPSHHRPGHDFRRDPAPPSIGERLPTSSYRQSLFSKNATPRAATVPLRAPCAARSASLCDPFAPKRVRRKSFFRERATPQRVAGTVRVRDARTRPGRPGRDRRNPLSRRRSLRARAPFSRWEGRFPRPPRHTPRSLHVRGK